MSATRAASDPRAPAVLVADPADPERVAQEIRAAWAQGADSAAPESGSEPGAAPRVARNSAPDSAPHPGSTSAGTTSPLAPTSGSGTAPVSAPDTTRASAPGTTPPTAPNPASIDLPALFTATAPEDLDETSRQAQILMAPPDLAARLLPHLPHLRWVQSTWAGVAPILAARAALQREADAAGAPGADIVVTAAKGLFGPRMAEYVFGWLLALERRVLDYEALKQTGRWERLPWRDLPGRTLLLLGTGSIGAHLAQVATAFGLTVHGVSRHGRPVPGIARVLPVERLHEALAPADYVVASLPDTPATRGLLDADAFAAMRGEAILVNVGRGTLVDEAALISALEGGRLRAAVLDVFAREPLPPDHPFWRTRNLHVTPHVAAFTPQDGIVRLFADNLRRHLAGEMPVGVVDPDAGY